MAKSRKILAAIQAIGEKKYSVYGNPSYGVWYRDVEGAYHYARTASNAQCGYVIDCMEKMAVILTCHETKSDRTIIDNAEYIKKSFVVAGHGECHQVNGESEAKILGILKNCNVYETAAL